MLTTVQPFSLRAAALFVATGLGLVIYFQYEKARQERKKIVEMSKGYGKPKVGGPFTLQDLDGKEVSEKDLLGKYSIVSGHKHIQNGGIDLRRSTLASHIVRTFVPMSWTSSAQRSISSTRIQAARTPSDHYSFRLTQHEIHLQF